MENATLITVSPEELKALIGDVVEARVQAAISTVLAAPPPPTEGLTFKQVRCKLKLSAPVVLKLLREGRIKGQQAGAKWIVDAQSVDDFIRGEKP